MSKHGFVALLIWVVGVVDGAMVILQPTHSPFAEIRMRSVPYSKYLGPQGTDPVVVNITAEIMVVNGNSLCTTNRDIPDEVRGRVVLEKGAAALITIFPNGYDVSDPIRFYSRNRYQPEPSNNNMVFVAVEEPPGSSISLTDYLVNSGPKNTVLVSIQPDVSDWDGFYHQWYVQLPLRWIPAAVFGTAFLVAVNLLRKHLQVMNTDFIDRFPTQAMQTRERRLKFLAKRFSIVQLILAIELVTTFAMCAFIGIGGWQSNDIMPYQITQFFITGLSGWGFTCDVLSALLWTSIIKQMPGSGRDSWFGQFLEHHRLAKVSLCVFPLLLDTLTCLSNLLYINIPYMYQFTASLIMVLQLAVGIQFLIQALGFQNIMAQTVSQDGDNLTLDGVDDLLRRLSRWTLCLSLSMLAFVCLLPIAVTTFVYTHLGWVLFWGGGGTARALTSFCRVMMAQPSSGRDSGRIVPALQTSSAAIPSTLTAPILKLLK